jgi:hypothetical protein
MLSLKLIRIVNHKEVKLLAKWRRKVQPVWHETFKITIKGTEKWLKKVINSPTKSLYFVVKDGKLIGHVGYDYIDGQYYIDNVIRGEGKSDGSMTKAVKMIIDPFEPTYLLVLPDMTDAIRFYKKIGFSPHMLIGKYLKMKYEN